MEVMDPNEVSYRGVLRVPGKPDNTVIVPGAGTSFPASLKVTFWAGIDKEQETRPRGCSNSARGRQQRGKS